MRGEYAWYGIGLLGGIPSYRAADGGMTRGRYLHELLGAQVRMDKSSTSDGCQQEGKWLFTYVELLVLSTVISISISVCSCVCVWTLI